MKEIVEFLGRKHEVIRRYDLTDKEMKELDLYHRSRIRIKDIETGEIMDFANTTNM